jgi:acyl carrier protein
MNNLQARLANCFSAVFPDITSDDIPSASTSSLAAWDSVAHVTILSSVSEEFGVDLEMEDYEELVSFPLILKYLESRLA